MSDDNERQEAPDTAIITGYFLTQARRALKEGTEQYGGNYVARAFWYLTEAIERHPAGVADIKVRAGRRWQDMLPSDGSLLAYEACEELAAYIGDPRGASPMALKKIEHKIGSAHIKLSLMMKHLRFKGITNEDFERVREEHNLPGVGGGGR